LNLSPGDEDRVLPGEGGLPLADFSGGLREIGYDGVLSVELFRAVPADRAHAAMERLVHSMFPGARMDA